VSLAKVSSISDHLGQGLGTDFQKAMDMVLADIKARRLRQEDIPKDLIDLTACWVGTRPVDLTALATTLTTPTATL
jgi:hypothetical protein